MLTIQEVGTEILTKQPRKFYAMIGSEYGVKKKYIQTLENYYGELKEYPTVSSVLDLMSKKHLIPLKPAVYVVRYDEEFLSNLREGFQKRLDTIKIVGTVICIYDQQKNTAKLEKYLPNYTVSIDPVSPKFMNRYLHSDFPGLADNLIDIAVNIADDYNQAQSMCRCMSKVPAEELCAIQESRFSELFGHTTTTDEKEIKKGIAAKNFKYLMKKIENVTNYDSIIYLIMNTMVELDKISDNKYTESILRPYVQLWTRQDIYYMFVHSYNELKRLRYGMSFANPEDSVVYLFSLLTFSKVPDTEVLQ